MQNRGPSFGIFELRIIDARHSLILKRLKLNTTENQPVVHFVQALDASFVTRRFM